MQSSQVQSSQGRFIVYKIIHLPFMCQKLLGEWTGAYRAWVIRFWTLGKGWVIHFSDTCEGGGGRGGSEASYIIQELEQIQTILILFLIISLDTTGTFAHTFFKWMMNNQLRTETQFAGCVSPRTHYTLFLNRLTTVQCHTRLMSECARILADVFVEFTKMT